MIIWTTKGRDKTQSGTVSAVTRAIHPHGKQMRQQANTTSAMSNILLRTPPRFDARLQNIPNSTLPHTTCRTWSAWPYTEDRRHLDHEQLFMERNRLAQLGRELSELLTSKDQSPEQIHLQLQAEMLARKIEAWRDNLPLELRYKTNASQPLHMLQYVSPSRNTKVRIAPLTRTQPASSTTPIS